MPVLETDATITIVASFEVEAYNVTSNGAADKIIITTPLGKDESGNVIAKMGDRILVQIIVPSGFKLATLKYRYNGTTEKNIVTIENVATNTYVFYILHPYGSWKGHFLS